MAGDDDIEKLLAELSQMENPGAPAAAGGKAVEPRAQAKPPATKDDGKGSPGGRLAFAIAAAVAVGFLGAFVGMFLGPFLGWLPFLEFSFWGTGFGAAFGAFVTALVAGPPRWFSS